ncbi:MAG: 30S ribosomal protein S1 [Clostridia bacterium]|nr:30S ribosomal protein S1 [Clostridia bacterium]
MQNQYLPEGTLARAWENREYLSSREGLERAAEKGKILEAAVVLCDSRFSLHVDLGCMKGIMAREEVEWHRAGEEIKDIAILTRVGKTIAFKILGFSKDEYGQSIAVLSRRAAQLECMQAYVRGLCVGDIIPAKITHMESFGAFVDIGCGIISLLSIDCISVSRISHPSDRFSVDDRIYVIVKSIDALGRIYVSHRELLGTWEENAALFSIGQTVSGTVRSIESYGIFIELTPNLAGLAEFRSGIEINQRAAVYIKNIIPEKMKVKLVIIDTGTPDEANKSIRYFIDGKARAHIDSWVYSPAVCQRTVESDFSSAQSFNQTLI